MTAASGQARPAGTSPTVKARVAGLFYLLNILTIFAAIFCFRGIIVPRVPAATAANLIAHESLYRTGFALELVSTACSVAVAALLYELLKPVNSSVSLLAAFFRLIACTVAIVGYVFQLAPLLVVGGVTLDGVKADELPALGMLLFRLHNLASDILIVFFGLHFVLLGYLVIKSSFLPRALGVLACVGGLGGMIFFVPPLARAVFPYVVGVGLVAEVSLALWLLIKGVNAERWQEQALAAFF